MQYPEIIITFERTKRKLLTNIIKMKAAYSPDTSVLVLKDLQEKGLIYALKSIRNEILKNDDKVFDKEFKEILLTVKYLLSYLRNGMEDPDREALYRTLCRRAVDLIFSIKRNYRISISNDLYSGTARTMAYSNRNISDIISKYKTLALHYGLMKESGTRDETLMKKRERALSDLFEILWTSDNISHEESESLKMICTDAEDDFAVKTQIIGALLLSLLEGFNYSRFKLLLNIYDSVTEDRVAARAMAAIVLVLNKYKESAIYDPEIKAQLECWQDSILPYSRLRETEMALITGFDTRRIVENLNKNIIPEMMKMQPNIKKLMDEMKSRADSEETSLTYDDLEFNPKWEKFMAESGLEKKMKEMSEIMESGGDVMYATFCKMKTGPFFHNISHWFLPFEAERSDINGDISFMKPLIENPNNKFICSSDKYSMALSVAQIPSELRRNMEGQFNEMMEMQKTDAEDAPSATNPSFSTEVNSYVKDLYRFFTLFRLAEEFENPFQMPVLPDELPVLAETLFDTEFKEMVSEYFFRYGYFDMALPYLESHSLTPDADYMTYQKAGYCHQKLGNYQKALDFYLRASLFDKEEVWIRTALGNVYLKLHDYDNAITSFKEALESDPDNRSLLLKVGHTLLQVGKPDEALSFLYKLDYLLPSAEIAREIAWGEFLRNDFEKAMAYFRNIENGKYGEDKLLPEDTIRMGHISLVEKRPSDAYRLYASIGKKNVEDYVRDRQIVIGKGVNELEFDLIIENALIADEWPSLNDTSF